MNSFLFKIVKKINHPKKIEKNKIKIDLNFFCIKKINIKNKIEILIYTPISTYQNMEVLEKMPKIKIKKSFFLLL